MQYLHTACGGLIDTKTRNCTRCHKHWTLLTWWTTATEIRPVPERPSRRRTILSPAKPGTRSKKEVRKAAQRVVAGRRRYAGWGDTIPGVGTIASRLPNWPRWARILITVAFVAVIVVVIVLVIK